MKKYLFLILFFSITSLCFANVTYEKVGQEIDPNGNIIVYTNFKVDGVDVPSPYPKIDGKSVKATRYSWANFYGMTDKQIADFIKADLERNCEGMAQQVYSKKENEKLINDISAMTISGSVDGAVVKLDTDKNGLPDKELTLKTDGTKTEKTIEEVIADAIPIK
jgi:hypothetical protein